MSSAICFILPLYWCQPSASRADNQQPSLQSSDKHHPRVVREILFNVIFFLFFGLFLSLENKVVIVPGADNHFLFQFVWHASRAVLLFALRCLGTSQSGHPTKTTREKEGGREESEYNPVYCSHAHLLSLTPPGTRSDLCGDLAPSLLSLMRFPSALGKSHQIPCALQELSGGPS